VVGSGNGWWSFVHIDDASQATALALERGVGGALYNIVDDEPAAVRDWLPVLAKLLGAKPPRHVPAWLARIVGGEHLVVMMTEARAGSNAKARAELGWQPGHPSWRTGFANVVERLHARRAKTDGRAVHDPNRSYDLFQSGGGCIDFGWHRTRFCHDGQGVVARVDRRSRTNRLRR
jgi:nucleoside-diphosphate-sugar epimerase